MWYAWGWERACANFTDYGCCFLYWAKEEKYWQRTGEKKRREWGWVESRSLQPRCHRGHDQSHAQPSGRLTQLFYANSTHWHLHGRFWNGPGVPPGIWKCNRIQNRVFRAVVYRKDLLLGRLSWIRWGDLGSPPQASSQRTALPNPQWGLVMLIWDC